MLFSEEDISFSKIETILPLTCINQKYNESNIKLYPWLRENCQGRFTYGLIGAGNIAVYFEKEADATMFLLIWS